MAASSQICQSKRGRNEFWNGEIPSPDVNRTNSRTLVHDSALMSLLEKIDSMGNNDETDVRINGIINSQEDEIGLIGQIDHYLDSTDEKYSSDRMGSINQVQLTEHGSIEAISSDIADFTYYDNVAAGLGFFVDIITPHELGIMINDIYGYSMPQIMYSDALYGFPETAEVFHGSLWEDDIRNLNEHSVIRNGFSSKQHEEFGITSEVEFDNGGNDSKIIECVRDNEG